MFWAGNILITVAAFFSPLAFVFPWGSLVYFILFAPLLVVGVLLYIFGVKKMEAEAVAANPNPGVRPVNKLPLVRTILLSALTLGVYNRYWTYLILDNVARLKGDRTGVVKQQLFLTLIPGFSAVYTCIWWFTREIELKKLFLSRGYNFSGNSAMALALAILGYPIVSASVLQYDINNIPG